MGKRKQKVANPDSEYEAAGSEPSKAIFVLSDSDEAEANEDLSLRIVEKAITRAASSSGAADRTSGVVDVSGAGSLRVPADGHRGAEDIVTTELVSVEKSVKKKKIKKERWRKKKSSVEAEVQMDAVEEGQKASETVETGDITKVPEQGSVENNAVLRRLLRGPRYFDPPDSSWGACFNCGEAGHSVANCTIARRKKPCFVCGSFEHGAKQCMKGRDCFICKEGGHQAKDCPKKYKKGGSQGSDMCLKCGSSGHDMSLCSNDYSPDDLKDIQCYVCKSSGHLCCVNYSSAVSTDEMSCYRCGQPGHTGLACRGSRGETAGAGSTPSSCFKCGVEGHFARECTVSTGSCYVCGKEGHFARECPTNTPKAKKRGRDQSTPRKKPSKEHKEDKGYKSAPQEHGGGLKKKKKLLHDEEFSKSSSSSKRKPRGGWIVDDPGDYYAHERSNSNGWRSPATPTGKNYRTPDHRDRSPYSNSWSSRMEGNSYNGRTQNSQEHSNSFQHRYSASRFGNSSNNSGIRRNYEWW